MDDELTIILLTDEEEQRFQIPPPSDPELRKQWEAGVAERKAKGLGSCVGDYP